MAGYRKLVRELKSTAESVGWTVELRRGSCHVRFIPPPGFVRPDGSLAHGVTMAFTPSNWRGTLNGMATLRRQGVPIRKDLRP